MSNNFELDQEIIKSKKLQIISSKTTTHNHSNGLIRKYKTIRSPVRRPELVDTTCMLYCRNNANYTPGSKMEEILDSKEFKMVQDKHTIQTQQDGAKNKLASVQNRFEAKTLKLLE